MSKRTIRTEMYSSEIRRNPVYEEKAKYSGNNSNIMSQSVYLEFLSNDQVYSYALEPDWQRSVSDGSNGTVSTYTEGRVGAAESNTTLNNPFYSRNAQQVPVMEQHVSSQVPVPEQHVSSQVPVMEQHVSSQDLSVSIQSDGTTYDQIKETDITVQVGARVNRQEKAKAKARSCAFGRIILIITVVMALTAAGVLVYVFVINRNNDRQYCDSLPQVLNGQSSKPRYDQGQVTVTILCNEGYELHGNGSMKCMEDRWSEKPRCEPIECGQYPLVENGVISGTDKLFGSTANITCDTGFVVEGSTQVICLEDGNWSFTSGCYEHPCGTYTPSEDLVTLNQLTLSRMTLCLKCKPGLRFVSGTDRCVSCQNGEWIGSPECEVPGIIYFEPTNPVYNVGDDVSLRCVVHGATEWQSIVVARTDFQGSNTEPLLHVTNTSGGIETHWLSDTDRLSVSYELATDSVAVDLQIDYAVCEDEGLYICGNVVGAIDSPDGVKSTNTSMYIIDITSRVPEVIVPETMYVGIQDNIKCMGEIGKDENGTVLGEIVLQIKYKNTDSFTNLSSVIEDSLSENSNCHLNETIVSSVVPENDMHEASIQCIVFTADGIKLTSKVELLNIVFATVNISALPSVFTFGETATITSIMNNIAGWDLIEIRRKCSDTEEYIANIGADAGDNLLLIGEHIRLTEKDVTINSARLVLEFEYVKCSDSCGSAGDTAEYIAAVRINNSTWIVSSSMVMFQKQPDVPYLEVPYDAIAGHTATFSCTGEIGKPKGYLEIESIFEGTNFTAFLSSREGKDVNAIGSIYSITDESANCSNVRSIAFQIKNLTTKFHQTSLRCVSRPSPLLVNGQSATSDVKSIEVIPENYCSRPDGFTGARRHPFHCNMFVICHSGQVTGVPGGCKVNHCFQDTCYPCETIGGCSVTDIYVDNFSDWIQLGYSVTLVCKVKDFEGLTDIVIYRDINDTVISSFLDGDFEAGVTKVQDGSYISGNKGQLMVYIASVQCKDEGSYRCAPVGTGKYSEDETDLVVNDAEGNTVC